MSSRDAEFWYGGYDAFVKALCEEEEEKLSPLKRALVSERDPEAQRGLNEQIKRVKREFKKKRKAARASLFSGA